MYCEFLVRLLESLLAGLDELKMMNRAKSPGSQRFSE
jgi:hypothetical protein